jgi:hypothetical protein
LKFELEVLEKLIYETISPCKLLPDQPNNEFFAEHYWVARNELKKIRATLQLEVFSSADNDSITYFLRRHQLAFTELSDQLYASQHYPLIDEFANLSLLQFYRQMAMMIEDALLFIEMDLPMYFDREMKISENSRNLMRLQAKTQLKLIQKEARKIDIPEELIQILCAPFQELFAEDKIITYQKAAYLECLYKRLVAFFAEPVSMKTINRLHEYLVFVNFNSLRYYNFTVNRYQEKASHCGNTRDQIELFYREKTQLNQLPIQQGISLKPSRPDIKEQIGTWLSEEIYFLDKRQQLSNPHANDTRDQQAEQKIHTSLSVAHLSLAVKLLVEAKVITNRNYTELLRIVAKNFKTDRNEELSDNSLRNKYYSVENGTLRNMKEVLIGLINLVKQYGG